jgi:hypothetical protein
MRKILPARLVPRVLLALAALAALGASTSTLATERAGKAGKAEKVEKAAKVQRLPIVDRAIEHHGGDLYRSTETRLIVGSRSGSFEIVSRVSGDLFEHDVTSLAESGQRKVRQTNTTLEEWRDGEAVTLDEEGRRRAQSFVEARIYFPFLPFRLNDASVWKEDQGLEEWDGTPLRRVKVTFDTGSSNSAEDEYVFWFEPETGRLKQYAYSFGTGREQGGLRLRQLENYRRVGGLLFTDAVNLGVDGSGKELKVELLNPAYAAEHLQEISRVSLSDITVTVIR